MPKLVVTGGHATPAIAVIEALKKNGNWDVFWIGEKRAIEGKNTKTLESQVLPSLNIPFHPIIFPKLHRDNYFKTALSLWKAPIGFLQSFFLLSKLRPNVVLTFGSYLSFPVALSGALLGIPVVVHEQTAASGLANRVVGFLARRIAISFETSADYFQKEKVVLTGNPIRQSFFEVAKKRSRKKPARIPTALVLGGSRGSITINDAVLDSLHAILLKCDLLHVTGELDYERVLKVRDNLLPKLKTRYFVHKTLSFSQVEKALETSDFAISRAGANTVTEFAAVGLPAIFIPLPIADSDEQTKNATVLVKAGSALLLTQQELSKKKLLESLDKILKGIEEFRKKGLEARTLVKKDAAERIANLVKECV